MATKFSTVIISRSVMFLLLFVGGALVFTSFTLGGLEKTKSSGISIEASDLKRTSRKKDLGMVEEGTLFWKNHNFLIPELPASTKSRSDSIKIESRTIRIEDVETFYREAITPSELQAEIGSHGQPILLLHGAAFSSQTWEDLKTIQILCALGHHVIAVDLPGYGKSERLKLSSKGQFLSSFVEALSLQKAVIVSPSMSGSFSMPYIFEMENSIRGFIPVAPVSSDIVQKVDQNKPVMKIPTLIIFGERDHLSETSLGRVSKNNLLRLENSQFEQLSDAGHPAYLDQPDKFHQLVHNFASEIGKRSGV